MSQIGTVWHMVLIVWLSCVLAMDSSEMGVNRRITSWIDLYRSSTFSQSFQASEPFLSNVSFLAGSSVDMTC